MSFHSQKYPGDDLGYLTGYCPAGFSGRLQARMTGNIAIQSGEVPLQVIYQMDSPEGNAHILFMTQAVYHSPAPNGQENLLNLMELKRYRTYEGASAYADRRFCEEHPYAQNPQCVRLEQPVPQVVQSLQQFQQQQHASGNQSYMTDFAGKVYQYTENGMPQICLVRLATECMEEPDILGNMMAGMGNMLGGMGGGLLGGLFGGNRGQAPRQKKMFWSVFNEIYFWGTPEAVQQYWSEFEHVYATIKCGPAYHQQMAQFRQAINNAQQQVANNQMAMMNAQMQSQNRMSQMINDTMEYGNDINRQMYQNFSDVNDRVNRRQSEALRGVNSYSTGNGEYVEADVRFDHVYRNRRDSDFFAGTEGNPDMGIDWEELKRRQ